MLHPIPSHRLPYEWETIGAVLAPALERDTDRTVLDKAALLYDANVTFWRVADGYVVTQRTGKTLWILYAGGHRQTVAGMRETLALIEHKARELRCREVKFQGRDWRRIARGYTHTQSADGRWHFARKVV